MIDALPTLKERLVKGDPSVLFSVINDLSKVCKLQLLNLDKILVVIKYLHSVYLFIVHAHFFSLKLNNIFFDRTLQTKLHHYILSSTWDSNTISINNKNKLLLNKYLQYRYLQQYTRQIAKML